MPARATFFGVCFSLCAGLMMAGSTPAFAKGLRYRQYTVKAGDTIYDLARRFGCTERDLEQSNELGAVLSIGQKLRIPACGEERKPDGKLAAKPAAKPEAKLAAKPVGKPDGKAMARVEANNEPRSRRASESRDRSGRSAAKTPIDRDGKIAKLLKSEPAPIKKPARADRTELALAAAAPLAPAALPAPPPAAATAPAMPVGDRPVTSPSFDPSTGSISAPPPPSEPAAAAAPAAAADSFDAVLAEYDEPALPRAGDTADGPSDHKLVLDGRKLTRKPAGRIAESLDEDDAPSEEQIESRINDILGDALPPQGQSVGKPWRGRLKSAARLGYGEGYVLRRPNRTYGTSTTVAHVERVLAELRHKFPQLHPLAIGDLSLANGGPVSEHRSHQSGRDIDIGLCFHEKPAGYPEHFVVATEATLDPAATWALISALVDTAELDGGLEMIFLDYAVQGIVYKWALEQGVDAERLSRIFQYAHGRGSSGIVRHAKNHADHLHARFRCATGETGCR